LNNGLAVPIAMADMSLNPVAGVECVSARKIAGLSDVRMHDLRHTAATRLVQGHVPLSEVGRVLGHTQANTTYRYVNANVETARRAADVLATLSENRQNEVEPTTIH
jgi:integrase